MEFLLTLLKWAAIGFAGIVILIAILAALGSSAPHAFKRFERRAREAKRVQDGLGLGIEELLQRLDVREKHLREAAPVYRAATIPKRSGGQRTLHVPDQRTKRMQQRILRRLLAKLRSHAAACGFERGLSIVHNALPHVGKAVVVRLDVEDFFPSTSAERIDLYFRRVGWDADCSALLTKWTTHEGGLPQGAPTSPRLSNLVNFHLDVMLTSVVAYRRGAYTRYADDITISFPKDYPRKVRGVIQKVGRTLKAHGYRMHRRKKLHVRRRHQRQVVTGLVVNDKVHLPRATRRWLRAVEHRRNNGGSPTLTDAQLAGWRSLRAMIDKQR